MTDAELVARARGGDARAWEVLYERHLPSLWRYVLAQVDDDRHLAEEIVGDTVLAFVRGIGGFDPIRGTVAGWLIGTARHKLADMQRGAARRARAMDALRTAATQAREPHHPARQLEIAEHRARVVAVLDSLREDERLVLEWKYLDDVSVAEIAARLGCTEKSIESVLYRARRVFRERMKGEEESRDEA